MTPLMTRALDYARPPARRPSSVLALFAHATAAYPLFLIASLYGEWLVAWCVLGELDEPNSIRGRGWMHVLTFFAMSGFVPVGCLASVLNAGYLIRVSASSGHMVLRLIGLLALWRGTLALL